jgi:hypothetical protein
VLRFFSAKEVIFFFAQTPSAGGGVGNLFRWWGVFDSHPLREANFLAKICATKKASNGG